MHSFFARQQNGSFHVSLKQKKKKLFPAVLEICNELQRKNVVSLRYSRVPLKTSFLLVGLDYVSAFAISLGLRSTFHYALFFGIDCFSLKRAPRVYGAAYAAYVCDLY